ncbi:MAG: hypothetical protein R2764_10940 [Bacteroidales bacterium]
MMISLTTEPSGGFSSGLTLEVYGNFTNNNVVDNYYLNFRSDSDQQISLMAGKHLARTFSKPQAQRIDNSIDRSSFYRCYR